MRVIGAETTGASDLYWYVKADSPIKSLKDTDGKTIAYSTNGSSTHGIVTAFMKQYDLKAKPTATGGPAANADAGDVGPDRCRLVGAAVRPRPARQEARSASSRPATTPTVFKGQTVRLQHRQCAVPARRTRPSIDRYMKAYRETVDCMYTRPGGAEDLRRLAQHHRGEGEAHARRLLPARRDRARQDRRARHDREGRGRRSSSPPAQLTKEQLAELIQIPPR